MNKIMLIGNLGRDHEMNVTSDGTPFTKFTLAVNRRTKSSSGERHEETEWFNIVAWRQLAETCNTYLHKGSKVFIEGRLSQREFVGKDGNKRTAVEVIATDMEMLTPKSAQGGSSEFLAGDSDGDPLGDLEDHPF